MTSTDRCASIVRWAALSMAAIATPILAQATPAATSPTLFIASDSTAQTYATDKYPQGGWGQMLGCGLSSAVRVENRAIAARSTRTFIGEGRWTKLMEDIRAGDTVLIQFGHNDSAANKPDRYAAAGTVYRDNLLRMIWETRGHGGFPVLLTPVARRNFDGGGHAIADFPEYSAVVRELAASTGTPLIDLESLSRVWLNGQGPQGSRTYYLHYPAGRYPVSFAKGVADDTHLSELGARRVADLVAGALGALRLPVSASVLPDRPDLKRAQPLGTMACH